MGRGEEKISITWQSVVAQSQGAANALFQSSAGGIAKGLSSIGNGLGGVGDVLRTQVEDKNLNASALVQAQDALNTLPQSATRGLDAAVRSGIQGQPLLDAIANSTKVAEQASVLANRDVQANNQTRQVDNVIGNTTFTQNFKNKEFVQGQQEFTAQQQLAIDKAKTQKEQFNLSLKSAQEEAKAKGRKPPTATELKVAQQRSFANLTLNPNFPVDGTPLEKKEFLRKTDPTLFAIMGDKFVNDAVGFRTAKNPSPEMLKAIRGPSIQDNIKFLSDANLGLDKVDITAASSTLTQLVSMGFNSESLRAATLDALDGDLLFDREFKDALFTDSSNVKKNIPTILEYMRDKGFAIKDPQRQDLINQYYKNIGKENPDAAKQKILDAAIRKLEDSEAAAGGNPSISETLSNLASPGRKRAKPKAKPNTSTTGTTGGFVPALIDKFIN